MNRESEAQLLDFCTRQKGAFQESDWLESRVVDRKEMAVVCLFLAGVDWYGHRQNLMGIAEQMMAGSAARFEALVQSLHFDCLRFSTMLRRRLQHA